MNQSNFLTLYDLLDELGRGSFSVVYECRHKKTKKTFAVKVVDKKQIVDAKIQQRLEGEVSILQKVSHPNIVPLYEVYDTAEKIFMVMDLVDGGELFKKILQRGFYSEKEACEVVRGLLDAVRYLHERKIIHRDLKPENLLIRKGKDTQILLTDFGLSRILGEESLASTAVGTPYYVAPEIILARGYDTQVDLWSIGVITYFILAGFPPFMGESLPDIVDLILKCGYSFPSPYFDEVSSEAKDFIRRLLVLEPAHRMTADEAMKHPWIKKGESLMHKPLKYAMNFFSHGRK